MSRDQFRAKFRKLLAAALRDGCAACVLIDLIAAAQEVYTAAQPTDEQLKNHGIGFADLFVLSPPPNHRETLQ